MLGIVGERVSQRADTSHSSKSRPAASHFKQHAADILTAGNNLFQRASNLRLETRELAASGFDRGADLADAFGEIVHRNLTGLLHLT